MAKEENFTPNPDYEAYTADIDDIKHELPTSHEPDMTDERTASDYNYAIQVLGLDSLAALDFAQLVESNQAVEEGYHEMYGNAERELQAYLNSGDQEWIDFWSTIKEESQRLKAYIRIKDKEYEKKYGNDSDSNPTAQKESEELNELVKARRKQRNDAVEEFFESRPNGAQEKAHYQEYNARMHLGPSNDGKIDEDLEAIRKPITEAIENL